MSNATPDQTVYPPEKGVGRKSFKFSFSFPKDETLFSPLIVKQLQAVLQDYKSNDMFLVYSYDDEARYVWRSKINGKNLTFDNSDYIEYKHEDNKKGARQKEAFPERKYARVCFQEHSQEWKEEVGKYINEMKNGRADEVSYYFSMSGGAYPLDSKIMRWGISFQMYIEMFRVYCEACHKTKKRIYFIESSSGKLNATSQKEIKDSVTKKETLVKWEYYTHEYCEKDFNDKSKESKVLIKGDSGETIELPRDDKALFIVYGHGDGYEKCLRDCLEKGNTVLTNVNVFDVLKNNINAIPNLDKLTVLAPNNCEEGAFFENLAGELFKFLCDSCGRDEKDTKEYFNDVISSSTIIKSDHYDYFYWREDGESIFPFFVYEYKVKEGSDNARWDATPLEIRCAESDESFYCRKRKLSEQRTKEFYGEFLSNVQTQFLEFNFADLDVGKAGDRTELLREMAYKEDNKKRLERIEDILNEKFNAETTLCWNFIDDQFVFVPDSSGTKSALNEMKALRRIGVNFDAIACQINLCDYDIEDNNVLRFYAGYETRDENDKVICEARPIVKTDLEKNSSAMPKCIILAQSKEIAKWLCEKQDYYESKSKERNPKNTKYVPIFSGCIINDSTCIKQILEDLKTIFFQSKNKKRFCYFISGETKSNASGNVRHFSNGVLLYTEYKLSLYDIQVLSETVTSLFSFVNNVLNDLLRNYANCKSAIGSIMSRNGSHNIGSHVLAALSHNVGTMPDDQMLYQYIQHRMDYIATATTERPSWSQPTMFVGDMMKRFLSQRHLLNYICRSEGLKAWEFQSNRAKLEDEGCRIKFHIRKVDENGKQVYNFINYEQEATNNPEAINLQKDVSLAIPGGVVGQHAFFTIIENIIRNSAKHDWSTPPASTACLKEDPKGDLDVFIDFNDNPEEENIHFTIWTRLSDVYDKCEGEYKNQKALLNPDELEEKINNSNSEDLKKYPLHIRQQIKLAKPFIDGQGNLRRENWGLAEMKISAGYLQKADVADIGGNKNGYKIIEPCCIADTLLEENQTSQEKEEYEMLNQVSHLGYKFDVPKPKLILFIVDKKPSELTDGIRKCLLKSGIFVEELKNIERGQKQINLHAPDSIKALSYQYVVIDNYKEDQNSLAFPYRVIACRKSNNDNVPIFEKVKNVNEWIVQKYDSTTNYLSDIINNNSEDKLCETIINDICSCWVRHLLESRKKDLGKNVCLKVSAEVKDKDTSSGKSLATVEDVVEFAFNEGFEKALDTYKVACKGLSGYDFICKIIEALENANINLVYIKKQERKSEEVTNASDSNDRKNVIKDLIKNQLKKWLVRIKESSGNINPELSSAINYLNGVDFDLYIKKWQRICNKANENAQKLYGKNCFTAATAAMDRFTRLNEKLSEAKKNRNNTNEIYKSIDHFIEYLISYCNQVDNLLSKYAEKIATLPKGFSVGEGKGGFNGSWESAGIVKDDNELTKQLRYWRHDEKIKERYAYLEALSGTQSYLSTLEQMKGNDYALLARLAENALLRFLIIDERTREFLEKHDTMKEKYKNMGIYVANDKRVYDELSILESAENNKNKCEEIIQRPFNELSKNEKELYNLFYKAVDIKNVDENDYALPKQDGLVHLISKYIYSARKNFTSCFVEVERNKAIKNSYERMHNRYEVLLIHQGIIDKWLPSASHNPDKVEHFVNSLEKIFRYVVITTGRGTPANIPNSGRVLPFSTIQTTLFRQYPEKLILTDAIMNILPIKRKTLIKAK